MALTVVTQDLENFPGIAKNVSVDQAKLVPVGFEGDEQFVMTVGTSAYGDNDDRTAIQDLYIMDFKAGWCKSSGFAGISGKFDLDATHNSLKVKLDTTASGSDGSGYYTIVLDYNEDSTPIAGEVIAEDMEKKIRAISLVIADIGHALSYKNVSVEFKNSKFWIISGSIASQYTGSYRSSVRVIAADTNDCSKELGFDLSWNSEELAAIAVKETVLSADYTHDTTPLTIVAGTGVQVGDCLMISDGINTDYFTALSGTTDNNIVVSTDSTNNYTGILNDYTTTAGAKVQILREQDPNSEPTMWYESIDQLVRYGIKVMVSQIDYSS